MITSKNFKLYRFILNVIYKILYYLISRGYTLNKRIDLHMHSLFSDGELLPSELARRALKLNHEVIAITDHVDYSNDYTYNSFDNSFWRRSYYHFSNMTVWLA